MGNKLGASTSSHSLRNKNSSLHSSSNERGSTDSLSTFFSLSSHADQFLLKERRLTKSIEQDDSDSSGGGSNHAQHHLDDTTSTILTTVDDVDEKGIVFAGKNREELRIPENLLKKLTTEDWNDIVHLICSSMEQSLEATMLKTIEDLREKGLHSFPVHNSNTTKTGDREEITVDTLREKHDLRFPNSCPNIVRSNNRHHQNHTTRRHRLSLPSETMHMTESNYTGQDLTTNGRLGNEIGSSLSSHGSPRGKNSTNKVRMTSNPQRVRFDDMPIRRTYSGTSLDGLELNPKWRHLKNQKGYLTLEQLKDLGLSLQDSSPNNVTCERLSAFSMKCWHGGDYRNQLVVPMTNRKRRKQRHRQRSLSSSSKSKHELVNKPQMEQLCLLGPDTVKTPPIPKDPSQPSSGDIKADECAPSNELSSNSDDSGADLSIQHHHKHSHHHYHHFIHHSLSQPENLCAGVTRKFATKPDVRIVVDQSQNGYSS